MFGVRLFFVFFILDGTSTKEVCAREYDDEECFWTANITVSFCNPGNDSFVVYGLVKPPYADMAYCAGSGLPCPKGTVWVPDDNKCDSKILCHINLAADVICVNHFH